MDSRKPGGFLFLAIRESLDWLHRFYVLGETIPRAKAVVGVFLLALFGVSAAVMHGSPGKHGSPVIGGSVRTVAEVRCDERVAAAQAFERTAESQERAGEIGPAIAARLAATSEWRAAFREHQADDYQLQACKNLLAVSELRDRQHEWELALVAVRDAKVELEAVADQEQSESWATRCALREGRLELGRGNVGVARVIFHHEADRTSARVKKMESAGVYSPAAFGDAFVALTELVEADPAVLTVSVAQQMVSFADKMEPGSYAGVTPEQARDTAAKCMGRAQLAKVAVKPARRPYEVRFSQGIWSVVGAEIVQADAAKTLKAKFFGDRGRLGTNYDFWYEGKVDTGSEGFTGFVCCSPDQKNLRAFSLGAYDNRCHELYFSSDGIWGRHASMWQAGTVKPDQWYAVHIEVRGAVVTAYLDGVQVFRDEDSRFVGGNVGLGSFGTAVRFRNVRVTAPDGVELWSGGPEMVLAESEQRAELALARR